MKAMEAFDRLKDLSRGGAFRNGFRKIGRVGDICQCNSVTVANRIWKHTALSGRMLPDLSLFREPFEMKGLRFEQWCRF
jgi:hypothetical protein